MAVEIECREFVISSGTGNIDFTGFGFQPKACLFLFTANAVDNTDSVSASGAVVMLGMCDGTREWAMCTGSEDAQGSSDTGRRSTTSGCILRADEQASQVVLGKATFVSFLSDGVRVNRTTAFTVPTSPFVKVIAFGGSDVSVYGDIFNPNDTQDGTTATTALGFEADLIIAGMIGNHQDSDGATENDDFSFSIGWAINPDRQASNNQFCIHQAAQDAQGNAVTAMSIHNDRIATSDQNGAIDAGIEITAWSSTGFTATTRDTAAAANDRFFFLGLNLGGADANVFTKNLDVPTSTGAQADTDAGFTPIYLLGIAITDNRAFNTRTRGDVDNSAFGVGMTDGTRELSMTLADEHGLTTTDTATRTRNTEFWSTDDEVKALRFETTGSSLDTNGWTLTFGTVDVSFLSRACYLAIGDVSPPAPVDLPHLQMAPYRPAERTL